MNISESEIKSLLNRYKKITVYGLSPDRQKASHYVPEYIRGQGWDVVGVYPKVHSENNFSIYQTLVEVPQEYRKFLNVFRASEKIPDLVNEVLALGSVEVLWLQLGIKNQVAEALAEKSNLTVVSDRCLIIEHKKWF